MITQVLLFIRTILLQVSETLTQYDAMCYQCAKQAKNTFTFIKMCKENSKQFNQIINNLTETVIHSPLDAVTCSSLFITISAVDCSVNSHCDYKKPLRSRRNVLHRYISLINKKHKKKEEPDYDYDPCITSQDNDIEVYNIDSTKKVKLKKDRNFISIPTSDMMLESTSYKCKGCFKLYPSSQHLRQHYIRVHAPKEFKCPECQRSYGSETLLEQHKYDSHSPAVCSACGKTYANRHSLKLHEAGHKMKLTCQVCGRAYKNRNTFKKHLQLNICQQKGRKSNKEAKFMCDYCNKKFCHKPTLRVHIEFAHGNGKVYNCDWCNKKFHAQSRLKAHIVKHTQEKKFNCETCGGKFVTKESLLYHTRIHTGEKPYQCHLCERTFLSSSRRAEHIRRHHLGPTLECEICHHKFKGRSCLLKHRRRHFNPKSRLHCVQNDNQNIV